MSRIWQEQNPLRLVLIDNYDSFTYNLAQSFWQLGVEVIVRRNDVITVPEIDDMKPSFVVVSPGPGGPQGAGVSESAMRHFRGRVPILGVCLGHQVLARSFGAVVRPATAPVHGKPWAIEHDGQGIFADLPMPFQAARYHSLAVAPGSVGEELHVSAWTREGTIMAVGVPGEPTWGVQFHPESFMTPDGTRLLANFLEGTVCLGAGRPGSIAKPE